MNKVLSFSLCIVLSLSVILMSTIEAFAAEAVKFDFDECSAVSVKICDLLSETLDTTATNVSIVPYTHDLLCDQYTPELTSKLSFYISKYTFIESQTNGKAFQISLTAPTGKPFFRMADVTKGYFKVSVLIRIPYEYSNSIDSTRFIATFKKSDGKSIISINSSFFYCEDLIYTAGGANPVGEYKGILCNWFWSASDIAEFNNWESIQNDVATKLELFLCINKIESSLNIPMVGDNYVYDIYFGEYQTSYSDIQEITNAIKSDNVRLICNDIDTWKRLWEDYQKDLYYREFYDKYGSYEDYKAEIDSRYPEIYSMMKGDGVVSFTAGNGAVIMIGQVLEYMNKIQQSLEDQTEFGNTDGKGYFDYIVQNVIDTGFGAVLGLSLTIITGMYILGKAR